MSAIRIDVYTDDPHPQSYAALILLKRYYIVELGAKQRWQVRLEKRNGIVAKLVEAGIPLNCTYCGKKNLIPFGDNAPNMVTLDHIRPRCMQGSDDLSNLALSCRKCNSRKGGSIANRKMQQRITTIEQLLRDIQATVK